MNISQSLGKVHSCPESIQRYGKTFCDLKKGVKLCLVTQDHLNTIINNVSQLETLYH